MFNTDDFFDPSDINDFAPLLPMFQGCHRARYAELMSPDEMLELQADMGLNDRPPGWVVYAELSPEDIDLLSDRQSPGMRLQVLEFHEGLPVVVLSTQAEHVLFQWVIPMWQEGASAWLRDAISRGYFSMVVLAQNSSVSATLMAGEGMLERTDELLRAATPAFKPDGAARIFEMLSAGLEVMDAEAPEIQPDYQEIRVMVAARGADAMRLHEMYALGAELVEQNTVPAGTAIH